MRHDRRMSVVHRPAGCGAVRRGRRHHAGNRTRPAITTGAEDVGRSMTIRLRRVDRLDTGRSITTGSNHTGRGGAGGWSHPAFGALTAAAPDFSATIAGELTIVTVADRPCVTRKQRSWLVAVSLMAATKQRGFPVSGGTTLTCTAVLFRRGGGE